MCLAVPGKVIEITEENGLRMGRIDYAGTVSGACLEYIPDVQVGQYVIVHAGFAINVIDEAEAKKILDLWNEMAEKSAEQGMDIFGNPLDKKSGEQPDKS